jgi:hypothetical protein
MMKQSIEELPVSLDLPGAKFQLAEWGEKIAVAYVQLAAGADAAPLLSGLPADHCPCPHWGYVLQGAVQVSYTDGTEETVGAGEAFYWPPGHTIRADQDTRFLDFSPRQELKEVYDHIGRKVRG